MSVATTIYNLASALQTANGNSGDLTVGSYVELAVDINVTAKQGTTPTIEFFIDRKGADGIYYNIYDSTLINNTAPTTKSDSIGTGLNVNKSFAGTIQFRWTIGGSSTPGYTFSASIQAK